MHRLLKTTIAAIAFPGFLGLSLPASAQQGDLLLPPATFPRQAEAPAVAPPAQTSPETNPDDEAFADALKKMAPLTPDQVRTMRRTLDDIERAQGQPLTPVAPVTRSISVSLRSGEKPATIRVGPGWISTLTFSDVTGQPWPVLSVTNGNPDVYDIKSSGPEGSTNIITISSRYAHIPTNIAVTLVGAQVPILMTLEPSAGAIDYRVDALLDRRGPNATYDVIATDSLPATGDSVMLSFLDGVPPQGAVRLNTSHRDVQAWRYNDVMYVRTGRTLLSPAYTGKQSNASGVNVFVLGEAPVLLVSDNGRMESVHISR